MYNNPNRRLHNLYLFLGIIVFAIAIWQFVVQLVIPHFQQVTPPSTSPGNTQPFSPAAEPRPQSANDIASKLGGDPNDWHPYDPSGWIYRGGPETNAFIVPHRCVVDISSGRLYPGDQVQPQVSLTIYYNVSDYDLKGHSP